VLGLLSACDSGHPLPQQEATVMPEITIESIGGYVGRGGAAPTRGRVAWSALSADDRAKIDKLFTAKAKVDANMKYLLTRERDGRTETVEARLEDVPQKLLDSMQTTLK